MRFVLGFLLLLLSVALTMASELDEKIIPHRYRVFIGDYTSRATTNEATIMDTFGDALFDQYGMVSVNPQVQSNRVSLSGVSIEMTEEQSTTIEIILDNVVTRYDVKLSTNGLENTANAVKFSAMCRRIPLQGEPQMLSLVDWPVGLGTAFDIVSLSDDGPFSKVFVVINKVKDPREIGSAAVREPDKGQQ